MTGSRSFLSISIYVGVVCAVCFVPAVHQNSPAAPDRAAAAATHASPANSSSSLRGSVSRFCTAPVAAFIRARTPGEVRSEDCTGVVFSAMKSKAQGGGGGEGTGAQPQRGGRGGGTAGWVEACDCEKGRGGGTGARQPGGALYVSDGSGLPSTSVTNTKPSAMETGWMR